MTSRLALVFSLMLLSSCALPHRSSPPVSQIWPTTRGALSSSDYAVPVFRSWPDRPYRIIGNLQFPKSAAAWSDADTVSAAQSAKSQDGDALVLRFPGEFSAGNEKNFAANPIAFSPTSPSALIIQWKTADEIAADKQVWENFRASFTAAHPNAAVSPEFFEMASAYAAYLGLNVSLPADANQLSSILFKICEHSPQWLYRGVLHVNTQRTSYTDTIYGVATLTASDTKLAIVSAYGRAAMSFNGERHDSHITGQIGVTSGNLICPMNAQGVMLPSRISLDTHGQTNNVVVRGSFTLLR